MNALARRTLRLVALLPLAAALSCTDSIPSPTGVQSPWGDGPSAPGFTGVIFWTDDGTLPPIDVSVDDHDVGTIGSVLEGPPICGEPGVLTMTVIAGGPPASASSSAGGDGSAVGESSLCASPPPVDSTTTLQIPPAMALEHSSSVEPSCGRYGGVTVSLDPGRHVFSATGSAGSQWSGSVLLEPGMCMAIRLQQAAPAELR